MSPDVTLPVYWDELFVKHNPPQGSFNLPSLELVAADESHPDSPERVQNIKHIIEETLSEYATWESVNPATTDQLSQVHDITMVEEFQQFCEDGGGYLGPGRFTGANEYSYEAAIRSSGAAIQAAERAVESGIEQTPYALARPSGHHAQPNQMDGFCFFNNIAVAAEHILDTGQVDSVAIIDWDVHHGNGTQEIFYDRDDVLFVSIHADHRSWSDWHPQTGLPEESGTGSGEGYNVNIPLPHGAGNESYGYAFDQIVEPVVSEYGPDLILVSAGQDGGIVDPLARNVLTKAGFEDLGSRVRSLAVRHANSNLAIVQEGGYQPSHLGFATLGVLEGVLDVDTEVDEDPYAIYSEENLNEVVDAIHKAGSVISQHWPLNFEPGGNE